MQQGGDGKVTGVAVFLKAGSTNATIQKLWQGMPNTPGKEQEVVGSKVIPAASCTPRSRRCRFSRGPGGTMALRTILLTGLKILIVWPFHDPNSANAISRLLETLQYKAVCFVKSGIINCDRCQVNKTWQVKHQIAF